MHTDDDEKLKQTTETVKISNRSKAYDSVAEQLQLSQLLGCSFANVR